MLLLSKFGGETSVYYNNVRIMAYSRPNNTIAHQMYKTLLAIRRRNRFLLINQRLALTLYYPQCNLKAKSKHFKFISVFATVTYYKRRSSGPNRHLLKRTYYSFSLFYV